MKRHSKQAKQQQQQQKTNGKKAMKRITNIMDSCECMRIKKSYYYPRTKNIVVNNNLFNANNDIETEKRNKQNIKSQRFSLKYTFFYLFGNGII